MPSFDARKQLDPIQAGLGRLFVSGISMIVALASPCRSGPSPFSRTSPIDSPRNRLLLDGQHSIAIQLRGEPRVLQSFRYFVGNIPGAGQFVRCAGVVE